jgi:hypothetical protein
MRPSTGGLDDEGLGNRDGIRGLIDHREPAVEQEQYHDDLEGAQGRTVGLDNSNSNRLRVEPSGLVANNDSEPWSDGV